MLAGESYNCLDPGLEAIRQKAKELFQRFSPAETLADRQIILQ
jgi:hypothetical protein